MTTDNVLARRLHGLDALRGLAAMGVLLYHYSWAYDAIGPRHAAPGLWATFPYGNFGVELFFIISGFVIVMTLERTKTARAFILSRAARLYPAFIACLCTTLLVSRVTNHSPGKGYGSQLVANLTMAPALFGFPGLDGSYWSLQYELVFYALAALAVLGLNIPRLEISCLVWLGCAIGIRIFWPDPTRLIQLLTAARFAHLFIIGVMLHCLHKGQSSSLTWVTLFAALFTASFGPHWAAEPLPVPVYVMMIAGFALAVWLATSRWAGWMDQAPLRFLGRISYPLYLVHQVAGFALLTRLEGWGINPNLSFAATTVAAILLAWAISGTIEWPAQRWLRGRFAVWAGLSVKPLPVSRPI